MNCDEMAGDRLTVCEQELIWAFAHLVSLLSSYLTSGVDRLLHLPSAEAVSARLHLVSITGWQVTFKVIQG